MGRVALFVVAAAMAAALPSVAVAATEPTPVVKTSPHWQSSDGSGDDISITVTVADGATSTCVLYRDDTDLQTWSPCLPTYTFPAADLVDGDYRLAAQSESRGHPRLGRGRVRRRPGGAGGADLDAVRTGGTW